MSRETQVRFCERRGVRFPPPTLLVVLCHSQEQAAQVKARLAEWLAPRGPAFNEDKTKIVHLSEGFDFLAFNIRRYPDRKLLIKPSTAAVRRVRERLAPEMRTLRGGTAMAVIATLTPVIRGWAACYRGVVSCQVFGSLDDYCGSCGISGPRGATITSRSLDRRPVLRQVQHVQERPLGVRRPRQRRLPGQVLLDRHPAARAGQGRGITR